MSTKDWKIEDLKGDQLFFCDEVLDVYHQADFKTYEIHENKKIKRTDLVVSDELEKSAEILKKLNSLPLEFKPHLILDIDETLISSVRNNDINIKDSEYCKVHTIYLSNTNVKVLVPNTVVDFIETLSVRYQIWVFSMGDKEYVNRVLKIIDPKNQIPDDQRFFRQSIQDLKKDVMIMGKNFKKGDFLILDDNINSWKGLDDLRHFIVNSKSLDYNNKRGEGDKLGAYFFENRERFPVLYLEGKNSWYYSVINQEMQNHFLSLKSLFYKLSDIYIKKKLEGGSIFAFCSLNNILIDLRSTLLSGVDMHIISYNPSVLNCSLHLAKQMGSNIFEVPSPGCIILIDKDDSMALRDVLDNMSEHNFYDVKFIFDSYFYARKADLSKYLFVHNPR